jgi:hypothetical protein
MERTDGIRASVADSCAVVTTPLALASRIAMESEHRTAEFRCMPA